MTAYSTSRPNPPGARATTAAAAAAGRAGPGPRAGRPAPPPVSWALVFAGLLAGGALSFGAGVMTGTQITTVAYRGVLPGSPVPSGSGVRADDPRDTARPAPASRAPRDRQVAANTRTPRTAPAPATATAQPGEAGAAAGAGANGPARPRDTVAPDVASLVNLPQRDHWQAPPRADAAPDQGVGAAPSTGGTQASGTNAGGTNARNAPPPPLPKPRGTAPQRLTPMGGPASPEPDAAAPGGLEGSGTAVSGGAASGDETVRRSAPDMAPGSIWRVAAPADAGDAPGGRLMFDGGLTSSAHWRPAPAGEPAAPAAEGAQPAARYSVQVGAFREKANALEQAARMTEAGYTPRIVHQQATQSRLFMVRLGAFPDRAKAGTFARQISDALGVDTWPVANQPGT